MDNLTKTIVFDENSQPSKDKIWYRGGGKFYEYKNGKWVVCYDISGEGTGISSNMTEEEKAELRKNLGLYYEETAVGEKTIQYTDEPASATLTSYAKLSDDIPAKEDIVSIGGYTPDMSIDFADGYCIAGPDPDVPLGTKYRVVLNDSQGNEPGIYWYTSGVSGNFPLIYNSEVTTIHKIEDKYLPESINQEQSSSVPQVLNVDPQEIQNPTEGMITVKPASEPTELSVSSYTLIDVSQYDTLLVENENSVSIDYLFIQDIDSNNIYSWTSGNDPIEYPLYIPIKVDQIYINTDMIDSLKFSGLNKAVAYEYVDGEWVNRSDLKKVQELEEEAKTHQAIISLPATQLDYNEEPNMYIEYNYKDGTIVSFSSVFNKFSEEISTDFDLFIRYLGDASALSNASIENCSTLILKNYDTNKVFINVVRKSLPSPCGGGNSERNVVEITYASTYTPSGSNPVSESDVFDINYDVPSIFKINKSGHNLSYDGDYSVEEVLPQGVENPVKISDCFEFVYGKETNGKIYEVFNKHLYEKEFRRKISDLVLKGYGSSSYWSSDVFQDCANGNYYGIIFADDNAFYSITYATYDGNGNGVIKFGNITATMTDWSAIITTDNQ